MKNILKNIVLSILKRLAKSRLKKYRGKIVAVTGSIGKTSTKEAIYTVLNSQFKVKRSRSSMNSDFGVLLTILDIDSGYSSATKWFWLLMKAFVHSMSRDYSEILMLEMGVDKPGDMDFLLDVVAPDVAVITNIFPVHMAEGQFSSLQAIFDEKSKLAHRLKEGGTAILNVDDDFLMELSKNLPKKRVLTFGRHAEAIYRMGDVKTVADGLSFNISHKDYNVEVKAKILGEHQSYVLTPAFICGNIFEMGVGQILLALERFHLPPGRMNVIPAIEDAVILDSSYNSSPRALGEALKVLKDFAGMRNKVAVLGNMNELGAQSKSLHEMVGAEIPKYADVLVTVGEEAKTFALSAMKNGMKDKNIHSFKNVKEAIDFFAGKVEKGDVFLVKGSQNNVRLERFVKAYMAHPEEAKELLVRQEREWELKI